MKLIKDGKVAVVYSPGFGAGWSTWDDPEHREFLCMDRAIAEAVLRGDTNEAVRVAKAKVPSLYCGGADDLTVYWVKKGTKFEIDEYDGSESVHVIGQHRYLKA